MRRLSRQISVNGVLEVRKAKGKDPAARGAWGRPDPWSTAVYAFEDEWPSFGRGSLSLQQCRALVRAACDAYNLKAPPVRQHEGRAMSYLSVDDADVSKWFISFRLDHKNTAIVLHESAHYIVDRTYGAHGTQQDHGPTWQGVYFYLLARAELAPVEALSASARKHGLRWREIPPSRLGVAKSVLGSVGSAPST
jgi:hypothetical protein